MKAFSELFVEEYNTQREQWENQLKQELKLEDLSGKLIKPQLDVGKWPILSNLTSKCQHLNSNTDWKKAAQTYIRPELNNFKASLTDDLNSGVRSFFFHKAFLDQNSWSIIRETLENFTKASEIEVFLLGKEKVNLISTLTLVDENDMALAREIHESGGHNVHELALLTCQLIESLDSAATHIGVFVDSHFFKNIAKVRALKLLAFKVYQESKLSCDFKIVTLNSYREWTLYERYSNMLRNNVQVASGSIAGADVIQSSGYQSIFKLETTENACEHDERSLRMARNTCHILNLESMLGIVNDAAFGSFHLENLTHQYAESAWKLMQELLKLPQSERENHLKEDIQKVREARSQRVNLRKDIMVGMNDFPDGQEQLHITLRPKTERFRVARLFEELRLKVEKLSLRPKVQILLEGDFAALNNRINFIKNYFELIGLEVMDPIHSHHPPSPRILVLCARDEIYPELAKKTIGEKAVAKFVAGKVQVEGHDSIFSGQDIYQVLSGLVAKLEVTK